MSLITTNLFRYAYEFQESLSQSLTQAEDHDCRSILSRVLNVPEYTGRVRGKGFGVTQTSLGNHQKRKGHSNKEVMEELEKLKAKVRELEKDKEKYMSERQGSGFKDTSDKDSINCDFQQKIPEVTYIIMN